MEETEGEGLVVEWRREAGLAAVREYLVKELEVMGPTVLEVAAEAHLSGTRTAEEVFQEFDDCDYEHDDNDNDDRDRDGGGGGRSMEGNGVGPVIREDEGVSGPLEGHGGLICGDNNELETLDGLDRGEEAMIDGEVEEGELSGSLNGVAGADCDFNVEGGEPETSDGFCRGEERTSGLVEQQEMVIQPIEAVNRNCIVIQGETLGGVGEGEERNEGNVEQIDLATSSRGIDASISLVPTPEFNQVKENLRRSCKDLQNVVEDPLPDAKKAASRMIASKSNEAMHPGEQVEKHCLEPEGNQRAASLHSADDYEVLHTGSTSVYFLSKPISREDFDGKLHLDSDWDDDSIESDSDRASSSSKKLHLPSPKTARVSPLKPVEFKKVSRRRKRWSVEEEDTLREAVNKYGKGNWKIMLNNYRDVFQERTEMVLFLSCFYLATSSSAFWLVDGEVVMSLSFLFLLFLDSGFDGLCLLRLVEEDMWIMYNWFINSVRIKGFSDACDVHAYASLDEILRP
ncbi:uncharacterized protein LOC109821564 [Asparagus officinalis]|uniref:uncharacterized protein LOC109821564 n=1 Tax=Asparagus officinalis TaxID=4686 RepID=UPI00098E1132|nr:uncharacterized protein LOC109821564 [Asparagus officinalis]